MVAERVKSRTGAFLVVVARDLAVPVSSPREAEGRVLGEVASS
jgi:hypothetical protein